MSSTIGSVKNIVALVTGGASGLGKAVVNRLCNHGASVILFDLPDSAGNSVAKQYDKCEFVAGSVVDSESLQNAVNIATNKFGRLDLAVSCAGILRAGLIVNAKKNKTHSPKDFEDVLRVNTFGTFNLMRLAATAMCNNSEDSNGQRGVIVLTSSVAAYEGQKGQVAYAASKGAISAMTLPAARDLSILGVRVCTIAPGVFDTEMVQSFPEKVRNFLSEQALQPPRLGFPDEYAHLVQSVYENPMINGEVIRIDAGIRMQP